MKEVYSIIIFFYILNMNEINYQFHKLKESYEFSLKLSENINNNILEYFPISKKIILWKIYGFF